ncbi:ParB/RepB/Spo0J family partition protein [Deinococcus oregonensis]|uniref:ParB/RepB/Spo0J family partition protein n=1 Tax=Deinococcus oregonensis TaxID=1805970 RepID=A0ABV6ASF3_9DEIO
MSREDLLGNLSVGVAQGPIRQIAWAQLRPAPWQPRRIFHREALLALARSVRQEGVRHNLIVRPDPQQPGHYEIIAGERRWRASDPEVSLALNLTLDEAATLIGTPPPTLPCLVLPLNDQDARRLSAVENLQREDLDPVDEALYRLFLIQDIFNLPPVSGREVSGLAQTLGRQLHSIRNHPDNFSTEAERLQQLFGALGTMTWESYATNHLPLLQLPDELLEQVRIGRLAGRSALLIHRQKDPELRRSLMDAAGAGASFQELSRLVDQAQGQVWKGLAADVRRRLGARSLDRLDEAKRARVVKLLEGLDQELQ